MRIVHVVRQFHPAVGGLENVVQALATEQVSNGHGVRVVTLDRIFNARGAKRLPKHENIGGIEIVRIPYVGSKRYPLAFSAIRHIRDADVVHVHGIDFFFDYLAWTAPLHRRKLVVSTHGGFFHTPFAAPLKRLYFNTITRLSLSWYAGVATVGVADDQIFRRIRPHGVCLIENGVDVDRYAGASAPAPAKSLVSLGRFSTNKRLESVIAFVAALRRLDPEWSLTIAGRPWDVSTADLRGAAARLGVEQAVRIVENPSDAQVRDLMGRCSAFVGASDYEGFGLVLIEALSAGLWPVVSPIPTFRHVVHQTGLGSIVDFNDSDAAAGNFRADWAKVAAHHASVRQAAINAASGYRWNTVSKNYQRFYESALGHDVRTILDVPILVKTPAEAVDLLDRRFASAEPATVIFANAHTLNTTVANGKVRSILHRAIVLNDGIGVDIASRLLFGKTFPANLNGTDFIPHYLRRTKHGLRLFLLGGKPGVASKAAQRLVAGLPRHTVAGTCHGYFSREDTASVVEQIRRSRADILLVAFGNPHQEAWLHDHLEQTGCRLGFGVGGLFDFVAGTVPRAPLWMRTAHIEWAYRLMQEPARLWRRYLVQMPIFLLRVGRQWLTGARAPDTVLP